MSPLEIISRLCDVTENLSAIVKKQQTIIEQSKIEEAVRAELRQEVEETDREIDVLEYHMRKYCDTDDIEATEFGKENAVDDRGFLANLRSVGCIRNLFRNLLKAEERQKRHTGRNGETSRK